MTSNATNVASSYVFNVPLFLIVTFLLAVIVYNILHTKRDNIDVIKRKINTEIEKKLYY